MGIDRIGKGSGVVPPDLGPVGGSAGSPAGAAAAGEPFRVAKAGGASPVAGISLERVRSGEVSVSTWVDGRVEAATAHLAGRVAPEQLAFIQDSLRRQIASDPVLADLAKAATGVAPPEPERE